MMDIYSFIEDCKAQGLTSQEALTELQEAQEEVRSAFYEDYYSRPDVCAGWAQQDIIAMYRRER